MGNDADSLKIRKLVGLVPDPTEREPDVLLSIGYTVDRKPVTALLSAFDDKPLHSHWPHEILETLSSASFEGPELLPLPSGPSLSLYAATIPKKARLPKIGGGKNPSSRSVLPRFSGVSLFVLASV